MLEKNKIITLDNDEHFLIFNDLKIKNEKFLMGVKINNNQYENDFRFFIETNKNNEKYLEEITNESLIKLIVDKFIIDNYK